MSEHIIEVHHVTRYIVRNFGEPIACDGGEWAHQAMVTSGTFGTTISVVTDSRELPPPQAFVDAFTGKSLVETGE